MINVEGVPNGLANYLKAFYALSDNRDATPDQYADMFDYADDFHFAIGPMTPAKSRQDVKAWREKAWETISERKHTVGGVFVKSTELMLHGRVEYAMKDGSKASANWGGHAVLTGDGTDENVKMRQYRVWIVSTERGSIHMKKNPYMLTQRR